MKLRMLCAAAAAIAWAAGAVDGVASAAEFKVMASAAVKEAYVDLVPEFERSSPDKPVVIWTGTADMMKRLKAGETVDLVIIGTDSLEELIKAGKIVPGSRVDFVRVGVGIAVRAGAPKPDIGSADGVKRALLAAKSIGYSSGPSGVYLDNLFQKMDISDQVRPKLKKPPSGSPVGAMVASGEAEIGFQQVSELIHFPGVDFLGPLPPDIQQTTTFTTGVHTGATAPDAARALARFLAAPSGAATIRKHGMEPG